MAEVKLVKHSEDWVLEGRRAADQARLVAKLAELGEEEKLQMVDYHEFLSRPPNALVTLRLPVSSLQVPTFRFDPNKINHIGQGREKSRKGDKVPDGPVLHQAVDRKKDLPGIDFLELQVEVCRYVQLATRKFRLPGLELPRTSDLSGREMPRVEVVRNPQVGPLDIKRTYLQAMARTAKKTGKSTPVGPIRQEDIKRRMYLDERALENNAVVLFLGPRTESSDKRSMVLQKIFTFLATQGLGDRYSNFHAWFIAYGAKAELVGEDSYYTRRQPGPVRVTPALELARSHLRQRFPADQWNAYIYLAFDGKSYDQRDFKLASQLIWELLEKDVRRIDYLEFPTNPNPMTSRTGLWDRLGGDYGKREKAEFGMHQIIKLNDITRELTKIFVGV